MKVYRGPSTKEIWDDSHEIVDRKDLSKGLGPWTDTTSIKVNITKDISERQAIAHIEFAEADVLGLYQAMVQGWKEEAQALKEMRKEVHFLRQALREIHEKASYAEIFGETETLSQINTVVNNTLEKRNFE